jgi:hypothetical protein
MVTFLWIAFASLAAIAFASAVVALLRADDGYEDELGFHDGASTRAGGLSRVRLKRNRKPRWTSGRSRDGR